MILVLGDRGYDAEAVRQGLQRIIPFRAKRNAEHGSGLGRMPLGDGADIRMVESVPAVARAYEKRADIHEAFLSLGCALICWLVAS